MHFQVLTPLSLQLDSLVSVPSEWTTQRKKKITTDEIISLLSQSCQNVILQRLRTEKMKATVIFLGIYIN